MAGGDPHPVGLIGAARASAMMYAGYVERIMAQSENVKGGDGGDVATMFGNGGFQIASLSAGGAITAVTAVIDGSVENAYTLVRPPGHHAHKATLG